MAIVHTTTCRSDIEPSEGAKVFKFVDQVVKRYHNEVTIFDVLGPKATAELEWIRREALYEVKVHMPQLSNARIGYYFNRRAPSTISRLLKHYHQINIPMERLLR